MAQGFAERLGKGKLEIFSVGSRPSSLFKKVRDVIENKVKTLLIEIG